MQTGNEVITVLVIPTAAASDRLSVKEAKKFLIRYLVSQQQVPFFRSSTGLKYSSFEGPVTIYGTCIHWNSCAWNVG